MTFSAEQRLKVKNHICEKNLGTSIKKKLDVQSLENDLLLLLRRSSCGMNSKPKHCLAFFYDRCFKYYI